MGKHLLAFLCIYCILSCILPFLLLRVAGCKLPVWSYALLVGNFGGRIAMPTNPPYCLIYANTYLSTVPLLEWTPFNTAGSPQGLHLGKCMCRALLQVADLSTERKQQYASSRLIILHGAQFTHRFPTIVEPRNHSLPLRNAEGCPTPWKPWGTLPLRTKSSQAYRRIACSLTAPNS